jgi:transposase-like protein
MAADLLNPVFLDPELAREHLENLRWSAGRTCPHCGVVDESGYVQSKNHKPGLYFCNACQKSFTVTVGTLFERSHIPLNKWLMAFHLFAASKKGMSAKQLERMLGVSYKSAWFMAHRIREAMTTNPTGMLGGPNKIVEADETYWGSEGGSKSKAKKAGIRKAGAAMKDANKVVSLVERDGTKRSFHVASVNGENLKKILEAQIHPATHVMTDSSARYILLKRTHGFADYSQINHSKGEYARGIVTTNTVESSFAILKRGLVGTFHSVAPKHLQRYVNEFDFRWNTRQSLGFTDTDRAAVALKGIEGKRLTYRRTAGEQTAV